MLYGYIYKLTAPDGRVYIGQTVDPKKRWKAHKRRADEGCNYHISRAIIKYGWNNFKKEIIDNASSEKELDALEIKYIEIYNSLNDNNGFNMAQGGKTWNPKNWDQETKKRAAEKKSKKFFGENNPSSLKSIAERNNCSIDEAKKYTSMYGKHQSDYVKTIASKTHKGKTVSQKTREKMRQNQLVYTYVLENINTGEKIEIKNLYEWCQKNNISYNIMYNRTTKPETRTRRKFKEWNIKKIK